MSEVSEAIQAKCLAFGDRIIKLNDYLLEQAANKKPSYKVVNGKRVYNKTNCPLPPNEKGSAWWPIVCFQKKKDNSTNGIWLIKLRNELQIAYKNIYYSKTENMVYDKMEDDFLFKCLDKVVENSKFEIPEEMTNDEVNRLVREFREKLQYQGLNLEDYNI